MSSKRKVAPKKKRIFEVVQQFDQLGREMDPIEIIEIIESIGHIKKYAFIVHDKDTREDFSPVAKHFHCAVVLDNTYNAKTVSGWFLEKGLNINEFNIEYAKGRLMDMLAYLTHENAPHKYQYSDSEVISNFEWKKEVEKLQYMDLDNVIEQIKVGKIREYNKTEFIPVEMWVNNKRKIESAFEWRADSMSGKGERNMDVIYIEGVSGAGKTSYAKMLCEQKGYSYCVSSSSNDPLQDYKGHDALILDDLRPSTMTMSDLLKLLDNHTNSSAKARYKNRYMYECKLIIVTSVLPLEEFYRGLKESNNEPIKQLKRRCQTRIAMTKDEIKVFAYSEKADEYKSIASLKNSVSEIYKEQEERAIEKAKSFIVDFGAK